MTFEQAVETALVEVKDSYAQTYLHALNLSELEYGSEGIRVQLLYCLSNMQHYRGETARRVKQVFKAEILRLRTEALHPQPKQT